MKQTFLSISLLFLVLLIACSIKKTNMQTKQKPILKTTKAYIEAGYWYNKVIEPGQERFLREVKQYDKTGKLIESIVYETGETLGKMHQITVTHEIQHDSIKNTRKEITTSTCSTWPSIKKEINYYDNNNQINRRQEIFLENDTETIFSDYEVLKYSNGKIMLEKWTTSWASEILYSYEYDSKGFLIKSQYVDAEKNAMSIAISEVYKNDEWGNPIYKEVIQGEGIYAAISQIMIYENTYW